MTGSTDDIRDLNERFARVVMGIDVTGLAMIPEYHKSLDAVEPGIDIVGADPVEICSNIPSADCKFSATVVLDSGKLFGGQGDTRAEALMRALIEAAEE